MQKVLLIDDNAEMLRLHRTILEMEEYQVLTAQTTDDAFKILFEIEPDLILLDLRMPEMSGPEFLLLLEEKNPEIIRKVPVVFLTAMNDVPPSKAVGFIRKTSDLHEFLEDVGRFIRTKSSN